MKLKLKGGTSFPIQNGDILWSIVYSYVKLPEDIQHVSTHLIFQVGWQMMAMFVSPGTCWLVGAGLVSAVRLAGAGHRQRTQQESQEPRMAGGEFDQPDGCRLFASTPVSFAARVAWQLDEVP